MSPHVRRAVALVALALALGASCTFLGRWQWNRHVARDAQIRIIEDNYDAAPVALDELLASTTATLPGSDVWRQAVVTGTYETSGTVLLRNRPISGQPGYHVLVPFVVSDGGQAGAVLLIDRGWVPTSDNAEDAVTIPSPPPGSVTVTVHLRQDEPASTRAAPAGQVQRITIAHVLEVGGSAPVDGARSVYRAYGALAHEDPSPPTAPSMLPEPSTDPGSHLSYAFQWWTFALGSLVAFSVMARRELVEQSDELPDARPVRPRRSPSAEDEEDAILDAQERAQDAPDPQAAAARSQASETRSR